MLAAPCAGGGVLGSCIPGTVGHGCGIKFWTRSVPSSDKRLGNHTPLTRHGPISPGWRGGATNLKRTNARAIHIFASPLHSKHRRIGFHHLSARSLSYPNPGRTRAPNHPTQGLPLPDKHDRHQGLRRQYHLLADEIGRGCRSPHAPDSIYSSARIRFIIVWNGSLARDTRIHTTRTLPQGKSTLVKAIWPM
jgi:hypothetical protein